MIKSSSHSGEQQRTNKGKGGRLRNPDKVTQLSLDKRARSARTLPDGQMFDFPCRAASGRVPPCARDVYVHVAH